MDSVNTAMRYMFVLAVLLMMLAYYVGAEGLLGSIFSGVNKLDLTATGRDDKGAFAGYPVQKK